MFWRLEAKLPCNIGNYALITSKKKGKPFLVNAVLYFIQELLNTDIEESDFIVRLSNILCRYSNVYVSSDMDIYGYLSL